MILGKLINTKPQQNATNYKPYALIHGLYSTVGAESSPFLENLTRWIFRCKAGCHFNLPHGFWSVSSWHGSPDIPRKCPILLVRDFRQWKLSHLARKNCKDLPIQTDPSIRVCEQIHLCCNFEIAKKQVILLLLRQSDIYIVCKG